jgi:hypothetical protein
VVTVDLDARHVVPYATAASLTLTPPPNRNEPSGGFHEGAAIVFQQGTTTADDFYLLNPTTYRGTFTVENIGGNGVDSAQVCFYGVPVGWARFTVKSYDLVPSGHITASDLGLFSTHYESSICDCRPNFKPYSTWADYVRPFDGLHILPDTAVALNDFSFWAAHWDHRYATSPGMVASSPRAAMGEIRIEFQEDQPLVGQRRLRATVRLESIEPFRVMFIALKNENAAFDFVDWTQDPRYTGTTMCASIVRDGQPEIVLAVASPEAGRAPNDVVGYFEVNVLSDGPVTLGSDDFALVTARLLSNEQGEMALFTSGQSYTRTLLGPTFCDQLAQNYPNPFNPTTTLACSLANEAQVQLSIFEVNGALVRTLLDRQQGAGVHRIKWDGRNDHGQPVASGVYFYRLVAGAFTETKKMTILK